MVERIHRTSRATTSKTGTAGAKPNAKKTTKKGPGASKDVVVSGRDPAAKAKRLVEESQATQTTHATGLGVGAAGAIALNREPLQISESTRNMLLELWTKLDKEAEVEREATAKAEQEARIKAEEAAKAELASLVAGTKTWADFSALSPEKKDTLFRGSQYVKPGTPLRVEDLTERQTNGHAAAKSEALAKKALGAETWAQLRDEAKAMARDEAEGTGNGRVRVGKPGLDWIYALEKNGETWAWEIQVGVQWSDRHNSDRDVWLNVRIDRDGNEFHRHTGQGH